MANRKKRSKGKPKQTTGVQPFWNNMTYWVMGLAIILPLLLNNNIPDPVIPLRNLFLSGFLLVFTGYFFFIKRETIQLAAGVPAWYFTVIGVFWLWSVLMITQAINIQEGLFVVSRNFALFFLILMVYLTAKKTPNFEEVLFKTLTITGLVHALVGILQFYGFVMPDEPGVVPKAFAANRSLYGSSMMLLLPFAGAVLMTAKDWWRVLAAGAITLELASIILSQTRSAWVALVLAFSGSAFLLFSL